MEWELRWRLVPSGKNKFLKYSEERVITFFCNACFKIATQVPVHVMNVTPTVLSQGQRRRRKNIDTR